MTYTGIQLTRCQSNDAKSQRELYDMFKGKVMGLCRRYTDCEEEAEDVFQETFIRVYKNVGQVREASQLEQWIKRIAVNAAINYYHKNKRHQHLPENKGSLYQDNQYELILSQLSDDLLIRVISKLPDGYRLVFNLYEVEGFSHAEIAVLLGISEVTSRSQLNRAKQSLKNQLKAFGILKYEKFG